jgi:hypothetical protein
MVWVFWSKIDKMMRKYLKLMNIKLDNVIGVSGLHIIQARHW